MKNTQPKSVLIFNEDVAALGPLIEALNVRSIPYVLCGGILGRLAELPPPVGIVLDLHFGTSEMGGRNANKSSQPASADKIQFRSLFSEILLAEHRNVPVLAITNHPDIELNSAFTNRFYHSYPNAVLCSAQEAHTHVFRDFVSSIFNEALSAPFGFGSIIQLEKGVADGAAIRLIEPAYLAIVEALIADPHLMHHITPRAWEEIIAGSYERSGFDEIILTPRSGDLGRDVIAIKRGFGSVRFIEQVKAYSEGHLVSADEVRAMLGVLYAEQNASKAIFTTTSHFAPRLHLDRLLAPHFPHRIELIDREGLLNRLAGTLQ